MKDPNVLEFLEMARLSYVAGMDRCMCSSFISASYHFCVDIKKVDLFDYNIAKDMFGATG